VRPGFFTACGMIADAWGWDAGFDGGHCRAGYGDAVLRVMASWRQRGLGIGAGKSNADPRCGFNDAGRDLENAIAQRCKLSGLEG
jgi:hypothetical protein